MTQDLLDDTIDAKVDDVVQQRFLDYAMSVIMGRALPDLRDGLKPVHRRILYAMHEAGNHSNKQYKKSARMVGDVIGKYHPHGDASVYDAAVRMAQPFSMNHLLIDGQGNFGSIDGDNAAAMRYTEMRMTRFAGLIFDDIDKGTVEFTPNYDGNEKEPSVLSAPYPLLLINGADGIAVGMACSMPPHNLRSVVRFVRALCENPDAGTPELVSILQAPDFPTGGIVYALDGVADAIESGRGKVMLRAKWHEEPRSRGASSIIIDELPYQVNKADLVAAIADLVREKKVDDISGLRDESNKEGIRIVIEIKAGASAEVCFAQLAAKTSLDTSFSYNCVVLDKGIPRQLGLKQIALKWIAFREEVILKRHIFERKNAQARLHTLEGFMKAISMMDQVVATVRAASSGAQAKQDLMSLLDIDEMQSQAILDLRLQKLTGMELDAIRADHAQHVELIARLTSVIESPERVRGIMLSELDSIADKYGRDRLTEIGSGLSTMTREDLIPKEDVIIMMTRGGYVKRVSAASVSAQNRGTRGRRVLDLGDDDELSAIYHCNSHALLLVFAESGQVYGCKAWRIPEAPAASKGRHIRNVIEGLDEEIRSIVAVPSDDPDVSIVTVSTQGQIKRSAISDYENATRRGGVRGLSVGEGDALLDVFVVKPHAHMMLIAENGRAIRFDIEDVRVMGRTAGGVRGMRMEDDEHLVGAYCIASDGKPLQEIQARDDDGNVITKLDTRSMDAGQFLVCIGERGVGKRTSVSEFTTQARGGKGVTAFKTNRKPGSLVAAVGAREDMDLVMFASNGVSNRIHVQDVRETGRSAAGVYLMNLDEGQTLVKVAAALRQESQVDEGAAPTESGESGDKGQAEVS